MKTKECQKQSSSLFLIYMRENYLYLHLQLLFLAVVPKVYTTTKSESNEIVEPNALQGIYVLVLY
jgi:hypothetical protein